ncbi:unnamed protein product [Candidula unifasciata]|uniref:Histone H2A n=1 Tax=Candidula unifasciata TaxID=100452 RepID=A0A8S3Z160_9EUPU|nr:unnamed protein product [Candidula unifasciata]
MSRYYVRGGRKIIPRSARAGVFFPITRLWRGLRRVTHHRYRISEGAPVYLAAVIDYLVAEVMELAGNAAREFKRARITPRHIFLAIANDEEVHQFLKHVTIAQGGVVPKIHPNLIKVSPGKKAATAAATATAPITVGKSTASKATTAPKAKVAATKPVVKKVKAAPAVSSLPFKGKPKKADSIPDGSGGFLTLSEKKLFLGQKLTVMQGDLVKMSADAIVHPTSSNYHLGGQVGQAIQRAGGKEFQQEVDNLQKSHGSIGSAEAAICPGHKFAAKFVIHVNSPTWNEANALQNLDKAVKNVLRLADEKNLKSVALPSISSGNAGFPKQTAAQVILAAIRDYFSTAKLSSLKQIYFVLYDVESVNIYSTELARLDG